MVLWSIDSLFYSIHRWCLFLLSLSLQVAWSSTAATYTDSWLFSHLCPLLSSTTNCPPASNTALHAGNQTKNLKTSHPTQNSYCCVSRGESATKQMNPLTNDASLKYTVKNSTFLCYQFLVNPLFLTTCIDHVDSLQSLQGAKHVHGPLHIMKFLIVSSSCT